MDLGFDATEKNNVVVLDNGASGKCHKRFGHIADRDVCKSAERSRPVDSIRNHQWSEQCSAVTVATVKPVVTANSGFKLAADASTMIIYGSGLTQRPATHGRVNNVPLGTVFNGDRHDIVLHVLYQPTSAGSLTAW